jgi:hypothetical protein
MVISPASIMARLIAFTCLGDSPRASCCKEAEGQTIGCLGFERHIEPAGVGDQERLDLSQPDHTRVAHGREGFLAVVGTLAMAVLDRVAAIKRSGESVNLGPPLAARS